MPREGQTNPAPWIEKWALAGATRIAETPRATVFRVTCADGQKAALKLLTREGMESEGDQARLLFHWNGRGMVRCLKSEENALLLEWLSGPDLVGMAKGGDDDGAARRIAETAIRVSSVALPDACRSLADRCRALTELDPASQPAAHRANLATARDIALNLLAEGGENKLLHGDLHHENIRHSARGWLAFDPKGVCGDPHHDLANAFRNPAGSPELTQDVRRIARRADLFAEVTGLDRSRLLDWAAAKSALSIAWFLAAGPVPDDEWGILAALLEARQ